MGIIKMSSDGVGTYTCTLDKKTLKKAKDELKEDPKQRDSQIKTLREWCEKQPHLRSRLDDEFLLRFLRSAKFSQLRAQEKLDNFWSVRSSPTKGVPEWFSNLDPLDPEVSKLLDLGLQIPLPGRDDEGRKVVLVQTGGYDPKETPMSDVMKVGFIVSDLLLLEEETQVNGVVILLDFSQFGTQHVFCWSRDTISKAMKCWQDVYPTRNKCVHYYNTPTVFNALYEIFYYFTSEKMRKRVKFHKASLDSLHKEVPKRMLPTEYGGTAGSMKDLIQGYKEFVIKHKAELELMEDKRFGIDEEKRPKKEEEAGWGIVGSFRKLAVD